ncbi:hypothetical protein Vadar_033571 [Vaccinium darrowii]|uniref:Uncharacterized protein n=1 Tax=Vaccinium darrowii TaxID=229202 RepID=A0ACB7Z0X2_9ERIC|nr:hypothetical protein Vadar_033571 [Vaccinium darrowii]
MSSSGSWAFEEGQISQPARLASDVDSSPDANYGKNLSRNGTKVFDTLPSSEPVSSTASSNRFPFPKSQNTIDGGVIQSEGSCRFFSLDETLKATNNFDDASIVGNGRFGKVYKGFIEDGAAIYGCHKAVECRIQTRCQRVLDGG